MVSDGVLVQTSSLQTRRQYQIFIFDPGWRSVQLTTHTHYRRKTNNNKDPVFREPGKYLGISLISFKTESHPNRRKLYFNKLLIFLKHPRLYEHAKTSPAEVSQDTEG